QRLRIGKGVRNGMPLRHHLELIGIAPHHGNQGGTGRLPECGCALAFGYCTAADHAPADHYRLSIHCARMASAVSSGITLAIGGIRVSLSLVCMRSHNTLRL